MTKYYPEIDPNPDFAALEEEVLQSWARDKTFEQSVEQRDPANAYVFYDGPPFANGLPHYGHLLTGYVKDAVARYQTMRGHRVERRFGWDCHGLPAEMGAEKELGISGRAAITEYGIGKFNEYCRSSVMKYTSEWEYYVTRQGRWVDFKHDYKTMDKGFMESCLWAFKELWNKGLVYESMRVMPYSWAAETPVSNFETRIDNATRPREDKAAYVKFRLTAESADKLRRSGAPDAKEYYLIAWTTTPWTLPSNLALAVNKGLDYRLTRIGNDYLITSDAAKLLADTGDGFYLGIKGADLLGLTYEPLFPYFADTPNAFRVLDGSAFVSDGDGTGIVHMAPGFGEDDQKCCAENGIEVIVPVDEKGRYTDAVYDLPPTGAQSGAPTPPQGGSSYSLLQAHDSLRGGSSSSLLQERDVLRGAKNFSSPPEGEQALPSQSRGGYEAILTRYARVMRKEPTPWEQKLWERLKGEQLGGYKFRRQQPIGSYIADFYNPDKQLIIELDGSQHADSVADNARDAALHGLGYQLLRFWNNEVDANLNGVCERILEALENTPHRRAQVRVDSPSGGECAVGMLRLAGLNVIAEKAAYTEADKANHISEKDVEKFGLANMRILRWLKANGKLVKDEVITHNYPHCWRTDTPLIYRAMSSWYINLNEPVAALNHQSVKQVMAANNQQITWIPDHVKNGQMGKGIESAPDWSISRNRFWGTPIPIWKSASGKIHVCGSIEEIERLSGQKVTDLHRPVIDDIVLKIEGEEYRRIDDVFDCWFESGAMPFAQLHYPFENKERFERAFPADFITEYIAQTRGWFYTLQVLSAALFGKAPFKNCICHGVVIDEETGLKYSKRLKNYKDPKEVMHHYGADALRWMMLASPVMRGADLAVDPDGKFIRDVVRLHIKPIWNAYNFFTLYANADGVKAQMVTGDTSSPATHLLDRYILAKCRAAVERVRASLDAYDTPGACEAISGFFEVLNNWYIRRSKERFWAEIKVTDPSSPSYDGFAVASKQAAYDTLFTVLNVMMRAAAPLLPFTAEAVYRGLNFTPHQTTMSFDSPSGGELSKPRSPLEGEPASARAGGGIISVHLQDFPEMEALQDAQALITQMDWVQDVCNAASAIRNKQNIRNRQPLRSLKIVGYNPVLESTEYK
ncbi:MAG: isoleucine--tRNA ligase, partial [Alphaproteobacteria bacterium]